MRLQGDVTVPPQFPPLHSTPYVALLLPASHDKRALEGISQFVGGLVSQICFASLAIDVG